MLSKISIRSFNNICSTTFKEIVKDGRIYYGYSKPVQFRLIKPFVVETTSKQSFALEILENDQQIFLMENLEKYCEKLSARDKNEEVYFCESLQNYNPLCSYSVPSEKCRFVQIEKEDLVPFDGQTSFFYNNSLYVNVGSESFTLENGIVLKPKNVLRGLKIKKYPYFLTQSEIDKYIETDDGKSFINVIRENDYPTGWKVYLFVISIIGTLCLIYNVLRGLKIFANYVMDKYIDFMRTESYEFREIPQ